MVSRAKTAWKLDTNSLHGGFMSKKVANGVNKKHSLRRSDKIKSSSENESASELIRNFLRSPEVKHMTGGIATAILSRLATTMSEKYPELSRFLKENIESFEDKMGQARPDLSSAERESRA